MKITSRMIFTVALLTLFVLLCACGQASDTTDTTAQDPMIDTSTVGGFDPPSSVEIKISAISELNSEHTVDSHRNAVGSSTFEANFREFTEVDRKSLGTTSAYYPRLKQTAEGTYILFFNSGETGPSVKYTTSTDLAVWSEPKYLFEETDSTAYATCDAVVLDNGDILAAASFRPKDWGAYTTAMDKSGIVTRRSTDGGRTWSDMQTVYLGMNWEPYPLQLSSGEVQIYFTHTAPYTYLYGYNSSIRSSGAAIIRSHDGGHTWTPNVTSAPYAADRVMQTYIGMEQGHKYFNDQMPVATELHNGTIMLACETLNLQKQFRLSVGLSYDNWKTPLGIEEAGPSDKFASTYHGSGPYTAQMQSGETLVSFAGNGMNLIIGDTDGKNFSDPVKPYDGICKTYWGSLEVLDSHRVLSIHDDDSKAGNVTVRRISYGTMYLNHDLSAVAHAVTVDGIPAEWGANTDAAFIGSVSQAQASVRFSEDDENIYILVERLDNYLSASKDTVSVFLAAEGASEYYKVTVGTEGLVSVQKFSGKRPSDYTGKCDAATVCMGSIGDDTDTDVGYASEVSFKKSDAGLATDGGLRVTLMLSNKDGREESAVDNISGHTITDLTTWQYVSFRD